MTRVNVAEHLCYKDLRQIFINVERDATPNPKMTRLLGAIGITGAAFERCRDGEDLMGEEMIKAFSANHEKRRSRLLENLPEINSHITHPVSAAAIRKMDIDPFDLTILSHWTGNCLSLEFPDQGSVGLSYYYSDKDKRGGSSVHLAEDISWEYDWDGTSTIEGFLSIPETVRPLLGGRYLKDVFRHGLLDDHELVIEKVDDSEINEGKTVIFLRALPMVYERYRT